MNIISYIFVIGISSKICYTLYRWNSLTKNNEYKIKNNIEKLERGKSTNFLDLGKLKDLSYLIKKEKYNIYYPYDDSEKVILYVNDIPKIDIIKINTNEELKHNEILGSLFGLNIDMDYIGDIIIDNDNYYIIVIPTITKLILNNLTVIGNKIVTTEKINTSILDNYHKKYEDKEIIVSSLRIDNVISKIINTSRTIVKEKIKNKEIILNYTILTNPSYILRENDIFSIRRQGKYRFISIIKTTKKENYIIKYQKYI